MFIRPNPVHMSPNGTPADDYLVYIGQPNTNPRDEANKLSITNGEGGSAVANPYRLNNAGYARNTNGEVVFPWISEQEYSIEVRSPNNALVWRNPRMISDAYGTGGGGGGGSEVDAVLNNFTAALNADMTAYDIIFIQSYAAAWEGAAAGPVGGFYAYRTGSTGTPSTGNPGNFYDSAGNQFKPCDFQRLYAEMFGAVTGLGNDSTAAIKNMIDTAIVLGKPCFLDGDEYYIYTQANTAASYSLIDFYAIKIDGDLAIYGNGNTVIKNSSTDNSQFLFFVEDVDNLYMSGLVIDGNSTASLTTGALYLAGVTNAYLDIHIKNSAPLYCSASTARQSGTITLKNPIFTNAVDYAISGNSGGCTELIFDGDLRLVSCAKGIHQTSKDIDGFAIVLAPMKVSCGNVIADVVGDLVKIHDGEFVFSAITGSCGVMFQADLETPDVDLILGSTINATCTKLIAATSTLGGVITSFNVDYVNVSGTTDSIQIDSADQLIGTFRIGNIVADGGIVIGDNTRLGVIQILGGKITDTVGITINQTNGQDLLVRNVDFSGCTTIVSNRTKSTWAGEPDSQTLAYSTDFTFAHNLGQVPTETNVFLKCTTNDQGFVVGDIIEISPWTPGGGSDIGFGIKVDSTNVTMYVGSGIEVIDSTNNSVALTASRWDIYIKCSAKWIF